MGILAGCRSVVQLESALRPDVVLANRSLRRLFLGDAKATETAGCGYTCRRLRRYLRAVAPWSAAGYDIRLAICAPIGSGDWQATLTSSARSVGIKILRNGSTDIGTDSEVAWIDISSGSTRPDLM